MLIESCKALVESLKDKEEEAALHSRQALNEVEAVIEQEKKSFRSSQDDRLQRVRYYVHTVRTLNLATSTTQICIKR